MPGQNLSLNAIEHILAQKRVAMVGRSRELKNIGIPLFEKMYRRGYDVVPANPNAPEIFGRRCFARVQDIQPPVDGALLMTTPEVLETVVKDCDEAGIRRVWICRSGGKGAVSPQAVEFCQEPEFRSSQENARLCSGTTPEPCS